MMIRRIASVATQKSMRAMSSTSTRTMCSVMPRALTLSPTRIAGPALGDFPYILRTMSSAKPCYSWEEKRVLEVTSPEEFEKRINRFKRLATEARHCIQDCNESIDTEHFDEEMHTAKVAVETASITYSELLEELALTNEGVQLLNEVRRIYAPDVESLRDELRKIGTVKDDAA